MELTLIIISMQKFFLTVKVEGLLIVDGEADTEVTAEAMES